MATKPKFARSEDFKADEAMLSYARDLFKARAQEEGKPPKFGCTLIFPKTYKPHLQKIVAKVITDQWGEKGIERAKAGLIKSPFLAGDGKEARNKETGELHPGMGPDVFFIRVSANEDKPPFVVWKDPNKQETEEVVYSGCFGKPVLNAYAWHNDKNGDGVSFGIQGFYKTRDGERIGGTGKVDPKKFFEKPEVEDTPDEARGRDGAAGLFGDDDIPF